MKEYEATKILTARINSDNLICLNFNDNSITCKILLNLDEADHIVDDLIYCISKLNKILDGKDEKELKDKK